MLSPVQRQKAKALAHTIKPIIMIGKNGMSDSLITEINAGLLAHELMKVKFLEPAFESQEQFTKQICEATGAEEVEIRGHIATLYRRHPERPKIKL